MLIVLRLLRVVVLMRLRGCLFRLGLLGGLLVVLVVGGMGGWMRSMKS